MKSQEFCYWLQGFFELGGGAEGMSAEQVATVKNHLALVFHHEIDASYAGDQQKMKDIHDGNTLGHQETTSRPKPQFGKQGGVLMRC